MCQRYGAKFACNVGRFGLLFGFLCTPIGGIICSEMISHHRSARGAAQDTGTLAKTAPSPSGTVPAPTAPLLDPAAHLSDDNIEELHIGAPPDSGTRQDLDAEPSGDDYEEEEEEEEDEEEEETDTAGEEIVDTTHHWTDKEAEAVVVRKWIA